MEWNPKGANTVPYPAPPEGERLFAVALFAVCHVFVQDDDAPRSGPALVVPKYKLESKRCIHRVKRTQLSSSSTSETGEDGVAHSEETRILSCSLMNAEVIGEWTEEEQYVDGKLDNAKTINAPESFVFREHKRASHAPNGSWPLARRRASHVRMFAKYVGGEWIFEPDPDDKTAAATGVAEWAIVGGPDRCAKELEEYNEENRAEWEAAGPGRGRVTLGVKRG